MKSGSGYRRCLAAAFLGAAFLAISPALAGETISHTYDLRGRLVKVDRTGTANNGVTANYTYDNADNRSNVTVTGVGGGATPSFSIGDATGTEGAGATITFAVSRSGSTAGNDTIQYATSNGSAVAGSDYTTKSGTLTFAPGVTSQNVIVSLINDSTVESPESFNVTLSSPSAGTITDATGVGTINNDDAAAPTTINLTSGGSTNLRTIANANGYAGATGVSYTFVMPSGVTITGLYGGYYGIDTGSWPAGVTLSLQVSGTVRGGGGNGGNGGGWNGSSTFAATVGGAGGDAIVCSAPITITVNSGGAVQSGGGGGGGGSYVTFTGPPGGGIVGGNGGGGGAPNGVGGTGGGGKNGGANGVAGATGTTSGGGAGGTNGGGPGGNGGGYATAGGYGGGPTGTPGGAAGYAVRKSGTGCTVTNNGGTVTGTVG